MRSLLSTQNIEKYAPISLDSASGGGWSVTEVEEINEIEANDATFIQWLGEDQSLGLESVIYDMPNIITPDVDYDHSIHIRLKRTGALLSSVIFHLKQNTTSIASIDVSSAGTSFSTFSANLSNAIGSTITNYNQLKLVIEITTNPSDISVVDFSWMQLRVPQYL